VTSELATLQDRAPPLPLAEVRAQIERGLGQPVDRLFAAFTPEPLAAASIAQVHRARTLDGREVVVKVQRPGLREVVEEDLALLDTIAAMLEERVEDARRFDPRGLVREFGEGLRRELDFAQEAASALTMRAVVGAGARVPEVVGALSCGTVLTLE
jgi:ubiquinone biosynthesis protein